MGTGPGSGGPKEITAEPSLPTRLLITPRNWDGMGTYPVSEPGSPKLNTGNPAAPWARASLVAGAGRSRGGLVGACRIGQGIVAANVGLPGVQASSALFWKLRLQTVAKPIDPVASQREVKGFFVGTEIFANHVRGNDQLLGTRIISADHPAKLEALPGCSNLIVRAKGSRAAGTRASRWARYKLNSGRVCQLDRSVRQVALRVDANSKCIAVPFEGILHRNRRAGPAAPG